ncbi:hypothetical protein JXA80_05135 [bacterium]|nr:hypothetical protein [candidate division CSSED10-310 bacterium]
MHHQLNENTTTRWKPTFLLVVSVAVYLLFSADKPLLAASLFLVATGVLSRFPLPTFALGSTPHLRPSDVLCATTIWIITAVLRLIHIDAVHSISDLTARFTLTAIQINQGIHAFPCIPAYEYDESLISWIFAPFLYVFGYRWTTVKTISVILSSALTPLAFLWLRRSLPRHNAVFGVAFIVFSRYLQLCDPLISMSRFSAVAALVLLLLLTTEIMLTPGRSIAWTIPVSLVATTAMYMHSTGRIVVPLLLWIGFCQWRTASPSNRPVIRQRLFFSILLITIFFIPFLAYTAHHPMYFLFKKRQIFGVHEHFPFSWSGLLTNTRSVLLNFHYKASLHMHFDESSPLLLPLTVIGSLGCIAAMTGRSVSSVMPGWRPALTLSLVPLIAVTPGHWRGLYFTVPVTLLTLGAGVFFSCVTDSIIQWLTRKQTGSRIQQRLTTGFTAGILIVMAAVRVPTLVDCVQSKPPIDTVTRLYEDMAHEPDIPHYFSARIPEMKRINAIFHCIGTAWFKEYGIFRFDPMMIVLDEHHGRLLDARCTEGKEIRLVLAPDEIRRQKEIQSNLGSARMIILERSQLPMVVVNGASR